MSAHGWWIDDSKPDDPCPVLADVTVSLYGYWCWIPAIDCTWWTLDTDKKRVKAKNKRGQNCETILTSLSHLKILSIRVNKPRH